MQAPIAVAGRPATRPTPSSPPGSAPPATRPPRPPLARHERTAAWVAGLAVAGFATHGLVHGVPGTLQYAVTIALLATLVGRLRTRVLPAPVVSAAAASVVVHLAGGLVRVGDGVLYNATPGPEVFRFDHLGHALGTYVGALLVWELLVRDLCSGLSADAGRRAPVVVTVLAALGLGALNEAVEFVATLVQAGSHVGGYTNTGWDLVTNTAAGVLAGVMTHRRAAVDLGRDGNGAA